MIGYVVTGKIIKYFKLKAPENQRRGWKEVGKKLKIHLLKESVNNQSLSKIKKHNNNNNLAPKRVKV